MACQGIAFAEKPVDVTSQFKVGAGFELLQLTTHPTIESFNTYADVPVYGYGEMVFNRGLAPAEVASFGSEVYQIISGARQASWVTVSADGRLAYWQGANADGSRDVYGTRLDAPGPLLRLSNFNMKLVAPEVQLIIGTSCVDPVTRKNVIPFSEGTVLHRVYDDGTALPDIDLPDPLKANVFHRMRLNPQFPWLLWYKRDAALPNPSGMATPPIYVADLRSTPPAYIDACAGLAGDHNAWSPDGTKIVFLVNGVIYISTVADAAGNLLPAPQWVAIHPQSGYSLNYLIWTPDSSQFLCSGGRAHVSEIYFLSLDGKRSSFVCNAASTGKTNNGVAKACFGGPGTIVFTSDVTGLPQLYAACSWKELAASQLGVQASVA